MRCFLGLLLVMAVAALPAGAQEQKRPGVVFEPAPKSSTLPTGPSLDEAMSSTRCDGTRFAAQLADMRRMDPEAAADAQIAAGDFTLRRGSWIVSGMSGVLIASTLDSGIPVFDDTSLFQFNLPSKEPRVACSPVPRNAPLIAPMLDWPDRAHPDETWCARAVSLLSKERATRYNLRIVGHAEYPDRDICRIAQAPQQLPPITDQPSLDLVPRRVTAVGTAARFGLAEQVRAFVEAGADLGVKDQFGYDALGWSVVRNFGPVFSVLVASRDGQDFCEALKHTATHNRAGMVAPLIGRCTEPQVRLNALHSAAAASRIEVVRALVETPPVLQLADANAGQTALALAVSRDDVALIRLLRDRGVQLHTPYALPLFAGRAATALGHAVESGKTSAVEFLLLDGADTSARSVSVDGVAGPTALHQAVSRRAEKIIRLLAAHRANLDIAAPPRSPQTASLVDPLGREVTPSLKHADPRIRRYADPPLFLALDPQPDARMTEVLLELGANPNLRDQAGETPLIVAITRSRIYGRKNGVSWIEPDVPVRLIPGQEDWEHQGADLVVLLLQHNADPSMADARGMQPVHHAARSDYNVAILKRLVQHGADINARDASGKSPLDHAREMKLARMLEVILELGGK